MAGGVSPQGVMNKRPGMIRVGAKEKTPGLAVTDGVSRRDRCASDRSRKAFGGGAITAAAALKRLAPASKTRLDGMVATGFAAVPAKSTRAAPAKADGARQTENSRACLVRMQGQLLHAVKIVARNRRVNPEKPPL